MDERIKSSITEERGRGADGLTSADLRASRESWWDDEFTRFLLRWFPQGPRRFLDLGCGIGTAAQRLLPFLRQARYLGVDPDEERLRTARRVLGASPHAANVRFLRGRAHPLPIRANVIDVALSSMTLQHVGDVPAAVTEVKRVLRPGGRFVAAEPDNSSNAFYLDGPLEGVNAALGRLLAAARNARRPADSALGPALPSILEQAGLTVLECRPYALGVIGRVRRAELFGRARRVCGIAAAMARLPETSHIVQECLQTIGREEALADANSYGYGGQVTRVFVTVADRPGDGSANSLGEEVSP